jgi:hypothetical protein
MCDNISLAAWICSRTYPLPGGVVWNTGQVGAAIALWTCIEEVHLGHWLPRLNMFVDCSVQEKFLDIAFIIREPSFQTISGLSVSISKKKKKTLRRLNPFAPWAVMVPTIPLKAGHDLWTLHNASNLDCYFPLLHFREEMALILVSNT